ncbi:gfo/Idh/MocA family oxidoreductase [Aureibaculum marinum]|uniref:Gfo/Idh/MocA family oxidoreductase n=1 Tax=Aureibaculum marinum TaxID=2487930 RepID=A0A3N4NNN6_9FLAO|nr:Gfo/Idh/MocA family oxidoreductase [Aureibaculum marinum]RPD96158.1 gfo/Idh/MocA family oxidoreductase [Aureibaculum marinum]
MDNNHKLQINTPINWGIIGCGNVTEVKSGPAFNLIKNSKLTAVMRRDGNKAKDYALRHQVPCWYSNADDLLNHNDINSIYIATPPSSHLQYTLKALKANKNVYLEKPMALNATEVDKICSALKTSQGKLTVAHYRRRLPMFIKIKEWLQHKEIGEVLFVDLKLFQSRNSEIITKSEDNWRLNKSISGGGYFYDLAPHQLDLMYYFFGDYQKSEGFTNTQDTIVNGIIQFKNGIQFRGLWAFNVDKFSTKDECIIYGSLGEIKFSTFGNTIKLTKNGKTKTFTFKHPKHIQLPMITSTVNYFLNNTSNPCSAEEGLKVATLMDSFSKK